MAEAVTASQETPSRDGLVFEHGGTLFGVDSVRVDAVIPWRAPMPVPGASPAVRGVVQDRGRIVTVLWDPEARPRAEESLPIRIVVCSTRRGLLGLPASATRAVGPVSSEEALTWIDPDAVLSSVLGGARP